MLKLVHSVDTLLRQNSSQNSKNFDYTSSNFLSDADETKPDLNWYLPCNFSNFGNLTMVLQITKMTANNNSNEDNINNNYYYNQGWCPLTIDDAKATNRRINAKKEPINTTGHQCDWTTATQFDLCINNGIFQHWTLEHWTPELVLNNLPLYSYEKVSLFYDTCVKKETCCLSIDKADINTWSFDFDSKVSVIITETS